jgi:hypothetical protein
MPEHFPQNENSRELRFPDPVFAYVRTNFAKAAAAPKSFQAEPAVGLFIPLRPLSHPAGGSDLQTNPKTIILAQMRHFSSLTRRKLRIRPNDSAKLCRIIRHN